MNVQRSTSRSSPLGAPATVQTAANPAPAGLVPRPVAFVPYKQPIGGRTIARYTPPKPSDATIIRATNRHVKMMVALQKRFSDCLGFLPEAALAWYAENHAAAIAKENGEPCGYILGRDAYAYQPLMRPITQAAVFLDAQRRHHGLKLVEAVCHKATLAGQHVVQASCAADLDAVDFWLEAGFSPIFHHKLENKRKRDIIVFRRLLVPHCPSWFWAPPPRSGYRAKKTPPPATPPNQ